MKKIFNLLTHQISCVVALMMLVGVSYGQCPTGESQLCVTYASGGFNGENGWALYNATTMTTISGIQNPPAGTSMFCVPDGNVIELYAFETFGDGWCPPAMISVAACEDGSANGGCASTAEYIAPTATSAAGNGGFAGVGNAGVLVPTSNPAFPAIITGCSSCEITCPDDLVVSVDQGVCGAFVECPPPTFDPLGCNLEAAIDVVDVTSTLNFIDIPGFANGAFANVAGTYNVSLSLDPLCNFPMPVCVDEICIDINFQGDFDFTTEQIIVTSAQLPGFLFDSDANGYTQCSVGTETVCLDAAAWGALGCSLDFEIVATGTGINTGLCAPLNGMEVVASMATACDVYATCLTFPDGSEGFKPADGVLPAGCTVVTYKAQGGTAMGGGTGGGTGSGTGSGTTGGGDVTFGPPGIPIECSFNITIVDDEAPAMAGPVDFTYNLQSGECCEVYDFAVSAVDNCPPAPFTLASAFCDPCADPSGGSALACGAGPNAIITLVSGATPGAFLSEMCFNQETFGTTATATVNVYCYDGVTVPFDDGAGTHTPIATATITLGADGACICADFADPMTGEFPVIPAGCTDLALEVFNANGRSVQTPAACGGNTAAGDLTFIVAPACGAAMPTLFTGIGFALDAGMTVSLIPPSIDAVTGTPPAGLFDPAATVNAFEPGDALGVGEHCFYYTATDNADGLVNCDGTSQTANVGEYSWCVTVNDVPNVTSNLTCDDHVNVSVDENCDVLITAGMFLEGGPYSCEFDCYEVYIKDEHGHEVDAVCSSKIKEDVDSGDVGNDFNGCVVSGLECQTYTYEVYDACRDNTCWGTFTVEDKIAPTIVDPADVTLSCVQSTAPGEECSGSVTVAADVAGASWTDATTGPVASVSLEVPAQLPGAVITGVTVDVQLSHSWMGDVEMFLTGPDGTQITLIDNQCGINDNMNATFDDVNGVPVSCAAGAGPAAHEDCNGSWMTFATVSQVVNTNDFTGGGMGLAALASGSANGTWTLDINDAVGGDGGCLEGFAVNIDWLVPAAASATLEGGCGDELTYVDDYTDGECSGSTIRRVWVATDDKGNQTTETQIITIDRIGADRVGTDWFWPTPVVELNCGVDYTPQGIYDYFFAAYECATPCPDPESCDESTDPWVTYGKTAGVVNAFPQIVCDKLGNLADFTSNTCQLKFTYEDTELEACVGCPGNKKIIRTWIALDWCTAETVEFTQIIHAKDTQGPVIDMDGISNVVDGGCGADMFTTDNITIDVGANPWQCVAEFVLPAPEHLTDNCSTEIDYTVSGPATVTYVPVEGAPGNWVVSGAPKGTHVFTYTATDCCGNEGVAFVTVNVIDNSPPTMIAYQNIVVGLTFSPTNPEAGTAKLFVESVDNGSHDGSCGPIKRALRRVDGDGCGNVGLNGWDNNGTFFNFNDFQQQNQPADHGRNDTDGGQFVKFCCNDLLTGDGEDLDGDGVNDYVNIMVELGAWDDANMDGWPGTPGDLFNKTWVNVRLEAKVNPVIHCPPNAKITCAEDENSDFVIGTTLGRASASTACGAVDASYTDVCGWDQNDDGDLNDDFTMLGCTGSETFNKACHYGPIVRTWTIDGSSTSCEQIIIIDEPTQLFSGSYYLTDVNGRWSDDKSTYADYIDGNGNLININDDRPVINPQITWPFGFGWPNNQGGNEAVDEDEDNFDDYSLVQLDCVDDLGTHEPTWINEHCSLVGWSLETDTINFEGDACRKIVNKYCVIDWCQYDPTESRDTYNPLDPESISFYARNGDLQGNTYGCGKWCWTVIGKLVDPYAPVVTAPDEVFPANPAAGGSGGFPSANTCVGNASVTATAFDGTTDADGNVVDDACPSSWLEWVVLVDYNDDWVYDREYSSFIVRDNPNPIPYWTDSNGNGIPDVQVGESPFDSADSAKTPPGEYTLFLPDNLPGDCGETRHRVEWTVYDGCGNVSSTTSYFTVQDQKAPTPYCVNLSTALMEVPPGGTAEDACVELWAIDFDLGSFDNCTADEDLAFTFEDDATTLIPGRRSAAMKFNCESLGGADMATLTLPVYVWDACGNRDFCLVNLRVIDTKGNCGGTTTGSLIAGTIETEQGHMIDNVEVMNKEMISGGEQPAMSDMAGFEFYSQKGGDYQLSGTKNDDYANGISTIDIVMIQRHILGIQTFDSAYDMIAADVNNDQRIDGADLVELRKLVLGIYTELPQNDSWRFIDADFTLDVNSPWNFDETREVMNLSIDMLDENFIGVKIGDVNGDVVANATQSSVNTQSGASINIGFDDIAVSAGQTVELTVTAEQANIYGYQFTLATPGLELVDVTAGNLNVTAANFGVFGDVVTTSWNDTNPISASGDLFTMTFKSSVEGQLSEILDLNSEITKAEAYVGSSMDVIGVTLDSKAGASEFALLQNEPNPFSATTTVGFVMAEAADATMTIYDVAGKVIDVIDGTYPQGYNEIELSKSDLGASGVLYYQLDSGDFTATKKMIVIE